MMYTRNRQNIDHIYEIIERYREEIEKKLVEQEVDSDNDYMY